MRKIGRLIIHCSATRPEHDVTVDEIRRWHVHDRKWSDIGYHALIRRDGALEAGRPVNRIGAHVRGFNAGSIGVCLAGGHGSASIDDPEDHFTFEQLGTLRVICTAALAFGLSIHGHNEFAAKACPGFSVREWLEGKMK